MTDFLDKSPFPNEEMKSDPIIAIQPLEKRDSIHENKLINNEYNSSSSIEVCNDKSNHPTESEEKSNHQGFDIRKVC